MTQEKELLERVLRAERDLADLQDAKLFHELFASTCNILSLEDVDVANALPVDRTTVNRWRNGKSVPRPLMRKPVYRFLVVRLRKRINDTKPPLADEEKRRVSA
jgi:hypothetical protein